MPHVLSRVDSPHICILGGGFGGLYTALQLSSFGWHQGAHPRISLIDQSPSFLFTPFLYELVTGEMKVWEIAPSFKKLRAGKDIHFCQEAVQGINLEYRSIRLHNGEVMHYDYLVLAVGKDTAVNLTATGADAMVYPFRTLADAERLMKRLWELESSHVQTPIRIAVVGGGPGGVELTGKLVDRLHQRGQIDLIERGDRLLKAFTPFSQKTALQSLSQRGVQVRLQTQVKAVGSDRLLLMQDGQTQELPVDLVVGTVGTRPRAWLQQLSCAKNAQGQLLTRPTLQLIEHPEVFALGDLAHIRTRRGHPVPATAQAAVQQAVCVAHNLRAILQQRSLKVFHYRHLGEMATLGIEDATFASFGIHLRGRLAVWIRRLVYLMLRMPTVRHRFQVAKYWLKRSLGHRPRAAMARTRRAISRILNTAYR